MYYAVKAVNGQVLDLISQDWAKIKPMVVDQDSIYKAFTKEEEAKEYLDKTMVEVTLGDTGYKKANTKATQVYGRLLFVRYQDESNGFTCAVYKTKKGERVTCKGYYLPENKALTYCFGGHYYLNPKYGYEFIVESFQEVIEDTKEGVIAYLASGVVKGIGEKKAKAIYDYFGPKTMEIIEKEPWKIQFVKGFSRDSAAKIAKQLEENRGAKEITQFLLRYGISQKYAMQVYQKNRSNALEEIKRHPYRLCSDYGIPFDTVDIMAKDVEIKPNNPDRMTLCAFYVLKANEINGDLGMEWNAFCKAFSTRLGNEVTKDEIASFIVQMKEKKRIKALRLKNEGASALYIFSEKVYRVETECAKDIVRIATEKTAAEVLKIAQKLKEWEKENGITLDDEQKRAVFLALTSKQLVVVTGGPGTGKTTVIKAIADLYEQDINSNIVFMAPTGRAARRMKETSGRNSHTIHSYLNIRENATPEDEVIINNSLIVVDEFSMADSEVAGVLFSSIGKKNRVVIVGDPDQLPSVGAGAVLRDILDCEAIPHIKLQRIHRQAADEKIIENVTKINAGDGNIEEGSDFKIFEHSSMEDVKNVMIEQYQKAVKQYGIDKVMCLCPYIEHTAGTKDMNRSLQDIINPGSPDDKELTAHDVTFRVGDPVMHLKNEENVSNGDIGYVDSVNVDEKSLVADINGELLSYDKDDLKRLTLAYATTVHKSQGSEADVVICCFTNYHRAMLYRNLPYVAFSRAKKLCIFVGERSAIHAAAANKAKNERVTLLGRYIKYYMGEFVNL